MRIGADVRIATYDIIQGTAKEQALSAQLIVQPVEHCLLGDLRTDRLVVKGCAAVLIGSAWQRCCVHFMRNVLAVVPKGNA